MNLMFEFFGYKKDSLNFVSFAYKKDISIKWLDI